jgi:cytosine/adenosine deaminase-related metal-dependent hydrolase
MTTFRADWVFTGTGSPQRDGVIEVVDREIVSVKAYQSSMKIDIDCGHSLITPGFVNAHTHLDLGALRGKLPVSNNFTEWLEQVIAYRRVNDLAEWDTAIQRGIDEALRTGTTMLGDISVGGRSVNALASNLPESAVYLELIGLGDNRLESALVQASDWLLRKQSEPRRYLSPHAPYTVSRHLLQQLASAHPRTHVAMHVAETEAELELLATHQGPFKTFLESVGAWHPQNLFRSIDELLEQLQAFERCFLIHGNYLSRKQWQRLPRSSLVVYCPRTHAYFGHGQHPYLQMLADGVTVLLGTDSLASNPDLSILNECRFLWNRDRHLLNGETVLGLGTGEAELSSGSPATFVVIPYETDVLDPWDALWSGTASPSAVCTYGNLNHFT